MRASSRRVDGGQKENTMIDETINNNLEELSNTTIKNNNVDEKQPKYSKTDKAIRMLAKEYPNANNHQLGKKLQELGTVKSARTVYKRLKKNDYLRTDIEEIRKNSRELLSREILPEALRVHKRVLKNKDIPDLKKKDWVAMAEKAEWKLDVIQVQPRIAIQHLEIMQIMVGNMLRKKIEDTSTS